MYSTALSNSVTESSRAVCPKCGNCDLRRRVRAGLLQKCVFPLFGYYPWECLSCRKTWMRRVRGRRVFRRLWDEFEPALEEASTDVQTPEHFDRTLDIAGDSTLEAAHRAESEKETELPAEAHTRQ